MCKSKRDEIIAALREHFPYNFIASNIFVGEDGKSKEGYTTNFKRRVGELLSLQTPPFTPAEIASTVGVDARCVMLWRAKYLRGHFNKTTPRDKVYVNSGKLTIVSRDDYRKIQTKELLQFSKTHNLTDEQFRHLSSAMEHQLEKNYQVFRENDGDWENLVDYLELIFMEHVTDPENTYQTIQTVEEVVEAQPIGAMIDIAQQRVAQIREHWAAFKNIACPPRTMAHVRCYLLSHKPKTPEDILFSMSVLPDWKTKQDRNRAYARLMEYCDGYVGPHVDKKVIPLTIRNKLSKQIICLPNKKWIVLPVKIMEYIEKCRIAGNWDWDTLMLPDCPIPRMSVQMRNLSGTLYQTDPNDDDKMLFGRLMQDINMWQYYVDLVKTIAPETAIQTPVNSSSACSVKEEAVKNEDISDVDLESLSSSIVDALREEDVSTSHDSAIVDVPIVQEETAVDEKVTYHITSYQDESYSGTKYFVPLDMSNMQSVSEIEAYLHNAIIAVLRAANPMKKIQHHDIVLLRVADRDSIYITGHIPVQIHAPVRQLWNGDVLGILPCNAIVGCENNRVVKSHDEKQVLVAYGTCFTADNLSGIILTTVNETPLHMEFVKRT